MRCEAAPQLASWRPSQNGQKRTSPENDLHSCDQQILKLDSRNYSEWVRTSPTRSRLDRLLQPTAKLRVHVGVTQEITVTQSVPDPLTALWNLQ